MAAIDIETVAEIMADVAERVIMPRWRNLAAHEIGSKARPDDIVTIADHEAEAELERRLMPLIAGSRVVGEEAVAGDPGVLEVLKGSDPVWVIDPIDGTRKFTEGQTVFDVMVALVVGGRAVAGWILAPAEGTLYMGEAGGGVVWRRKGHDDIRVRSRTMRPLSQLHGIVSGRGFLARGYRDPEEVRSQFAGYTRHTCAGHNYGRLLSGASDLLINFATLPWDHLPGLALVGEAGFHAARLDGGEFDPLDRNGGLLVAPDAESWRESLAALLRRT